MNKPLNALLDYRFKTKLLAELLEANSYFDLDLSTKHAEMIFEEVANQASLICENELPVPKNLFKKSILNEQVPNPRIVKAVEWAKAARIARELKAEKAAEAKAALEAQAKKAAEVQEIPIPIAAVTKGITPSQQEGLGKATLELLSGEALKIAQAKRYESPEKLAKELRDEMTTRFLQAGQESDPRLVELQKRMGSYIDMIAPAAIETAQTMQFGTAPSEGSRVGIQALLEPNIARAKEEELPSSLQNISKRGDLATEWMLLRQEKADMEQTLKREQEIAQALLSRALQTSGVVSEPEVKIDPFGEYKRTYTQEVIKTPEELDAELKVQAKKGMEKTRGWIEELQSGLDELRLKYSKRKMEEKISTPEERKAAQELMLKAQPELEKAMRRRLPGPEEVGTITPEQQRQMEFLRTQIPPGSIVR